MKTKAQKEERLYTAKELAKFLNVSLAWVYQASFRKEIPCYKFRGHLRFDLNEVKEWIKERRK